MATMRFLRPILAVCLMLAVAVLPGTKFLAYSLDDTASAKHGDCCPEHQSCPKQDTPNDCGSALGCALKCFNFTGLTLVDGLKPLAMVSLGPVISTDRAWSKSAAPPLPPPRV